MYNDVTFEIKAHLATLGTHSQGWTKELNIVSWNGYEPKYEIRDWSPDHTKCGKGTNFTAEELKNLADWIYNNTQGKGELPDAEDYLE